jgi:Fe-S-cluster containining protein
MAVAARRSSQCTSCGACCFTANPEYIQLWSVDRDRLAGRLDEVAHEINGHWFLKMTAGHCDSLTVDRARGLYLCSIYDQRPDACRAFAEDSAACELIRAEALLRRR